jgi:hypothetical protein
MRWRTQPNVLTVAAQTKTDNPHKGCPSHSSRSMTETYLHASSRAAGDTREAAERTAAAIPRAASAAN